MSLFSKLLAIPTSICLLSCVLFVLFGQITVRRLRKNPALRDSLGLEFYSGYDIFNVAQAVTLPRHMIRKFRDSKLGWLCADADIIYEHTSRFERVLGRVLYLASLLSAFGMLGIISLNSAGFFD